ncbi:Bug family tripartite tricarboxylate transporter substrate binding protein [Variovorax sp. ZT5P49]|uniref:Bug family tripartite tricarboxylate transporter substrate binding protein n=1 Tax=Variovorax sp. ZT5P49 TaxID=3443733 RepID=UPI003F45E4D8
MHRRIASPRRRLLLQSALAVAATMNTMARAQPSRYPVKPIRLISTFPASGTNDLLSRIVGNGFQSLLGQQVVVENRIGANGMIGAGFVAKAKGDPYTLVMGGGATHGLNPALYPKIAYDAIQDFTSIGIVASVPMVLISSATLAPRKVSDLIAYGKENPKALSFGSSGTGGTGHIAGETFKQVTGISLVHVPFKGDAPAVTDVLGGQIPLAFVSLTSIIPFLHSDRLRVLAVALPTRTDLLPAVPTFKESGVNDMNFSTWYALMAPAGVSPDVVSLLNSSLNKILADAETKRKLETQGATAVISTPQETAAFVKAEIDKYKKIVKQLGITVE